jgi:hypothetical protein
VWWCRRLWSHRDNAHNQTSEMPGKEVADYRIWYLTGSRLQYVDPSEAARIPVTGNGETSICGSDVQENMYLSMFEGFSKGLFVMITRRVSRWSMMDLNALKLMVLTHRKSSSTEMAR